MSNLPGRRKTARVKQRPSHNRPKNTVDSTWRNQLTSPLGRMLDRMDNRTLGRTRLSEREATLLYDDMFGWVVESHGTERVEHSGEYGANLEVALRRCAAHKSVRFRGLELAEVDLIKKVAQAMGIKLRLVKSY